MENEKYTDIESTIKALNTELKPVFDELGKLAKEVKAIQLNNDSHPLVELVGRLTKTARRHDADTKTTLDGRDVTIGTNHQGLGYQGDYNTQLTSITENSRYSNNNYNEQRLREVLLNQELVIDLTAIIKKSSQKTFLKAIRIYNKYELSKSFRQFRNDNLQKIKTSSLDDDNKIIISTRRTHQAIFEVEDKDDSELFEVSFNNDENERPHIETSKEENEVLRNISKTKVSDFSIRDIKKAIYITRHKETLVKAIKSKRDALDGVRDAYTNEHKELNELLQPLLALEKL